MSIEQIKKIENLIRLDPGKKIIDQKVKRLTAPGENYGSLMLSVTLTVKSANGIEELNLVAKLVPPNEFIQEIFNTQVTFRNEIAFYKNIIPTLQDFQRENGVKGVVDFAAKCYGSRLNLQNDNGKVDPDAALVLENLKIFNFEMYNRMEGLDLDATKLVLANLAQLHAVPLALKLKKPEVFEKSIKPYLVRWNLLDQQVNEMKKNLNRLLDQVEELNPLRERVLAGYERMGVEQGQREPWGTITHNDVWTNNIMFKLENKKPVKSVLVDYQVCSYGSPARDVVFLLYSSVRRQIIENNYDDLLKLYHETFVAELKELNCDTTPFTFDALLKEIDFEARHSQFGHVTFMLFPLYTPKEHVVDASEMTPDSMNQRVITDLHKEVFTFFINEFARRNWI